MNTPENLIESRAPEQSDARTEDDPDANRPVEVRPARILLLEDTLPLRERIAEFLEFEGHSVQTASNGDEGLERVAVEQPDLVLCDILMPGMDGYEFSRLLKTDPATGHIPIIILSARGQREEIIKGLEYAEEYVKKPIELSELKARVDSMLRLKRAQDEVRLLNQDLEARVRRRTVHLRLANIRLKREIRLRQKSEDLVRDLTRRMIGIREEERSALAMDIHDDVGQCLLAAKLDLQATFARLARHNDIEDDAVRILGRIDTIAHKIRQISHSLSPVGLRNLGLEDAIENLISMFADLNPNIEIRANFRHIDGFFPDAWDVNLYRIIQEAVSNTMKYARATAVELSDDLIGERLLVRIRDDGQGFSRTRSNGDGIGLFVMQERAQMLGGDLRINSIKAPAINHGTEVQIDIPRQHQNAQ